MQDGKNVILCIDDDPDILESLKIVLEANGYEMKAANNAPEGLVMFKEANPDLIIVDLMMEEIDGGTNFVKEVKATGSTVPIYMLSSIGDSMDSTVDGASLGLSGILQKPIDAKHLLTILKTAISQ
ncbi:Response regulator MprA [subsurface metagenome]